MKTCRIACLFGVMAGLAAGCTVSFEPARVYVPPPQAVVMVGMPDFYVWDGPLCVAGVTRSLPPVPNTTRRRLQIHSGGQS